VFIFLYFKYTIVKVAFSNLIVKRIRWRLWRPQWWRRYFVL